MDKMLGAYWFIFQMECLLLLRRSQEWLYPLMFFMMVICLFPFAFTPDPIFLQTYLPGFVWVAALLGSLLAIQSLFAADLEEGHLEQVLLSPVPLSGVVFIKLITQWMATELPLILVVPILSGMFQLPAQVGWMLALSLLLGTPILTMLGCLATALTFGLRQQGVMLGLLILPLTMPVLILGVTMVQQYQAGFVVVGNIAFLAALLVIAITTLPWVIAVTLRVSLDD